MIPVDLRRDGGGLDRRGLLGRQVAGDHEVGLPRSEPRRELTAAGRVEGEEWGQELDHLGLVLVGHALGRDDQPVAGHAGGEHHRAGAVVDLTALAGDLGPVVDLLPGVLDELIVLDQLPVAETRDERTRAEDEDDEQQEQPASRIGSTTHEDRRSLASGNDERRAELAEAVVERLLADGGFAAQSLHVRLEILPDRLEAVLLGLQADRVVAGCGDTDALAEREERRAEHDHDGREREPDRRRPGAAAKGSRGPVGATSDRGGRARRSATANFGGPGIGVMFGGLPAGATPAPETSDAGQAVEPERQWRTSPSALVDRHQSG